MVTSLGIESKSCGNDESDECKYFQAAAIGLFNFVLDRGEVRRIFARRLFTKTTVEGHQKLHGGIP